MKLLGVAVVGLLLIAADAAPASAEGLFDMLLGGATAAVPAPAESGTLTVHRRHSRLRPSTPRPSTPRPSVPRVARVARPDAVHKAEVAIDPTKVADWYMHDRTLRRGDIIVLRSGVLVYTGHHAGEDRRAADFARLHDARFLPARTREFVAQATATNAHAAAVAAPPKPKVHPRAT